MTAHRKFPMHSAVAVAGVRCGLAQQVFSPKMAVRKVSQGSLSEESFGTVQIFRGVPYAGPPP